MTRKICVVVTARPSYSRIRSVLEAIRELPDLELQLVVAASALLDRYGNAQQIIEEEGFHIDRRVYMIMEGENLVTSAKSTGFGLAELATVFDNVRPDAVVTVADRFETLATAISASLMAVYEGYHASPNAAGVSRAATRTVVITSVWILLLDFVLTGLMLTEV